jgi:hypothetical protein
MRWISAGLAYVLFLQSLPFVAAQESPVTGLNIVVVEGEGAINNIRQRTARAPIVQVEDQNRKPVAGAVVVFTLPERGASGVFPNGSRTLTVMTDDQGRATARGLRPNNSQGQMQIRVNASRQGLTASAVINQTNALAAAAGAAAAKMAIWKWLLIAGAAGGAAAAGAAVATGGNNGSTAATKPPTTVTPGAGTVGPPR